MALEIGEKASDNLQSLGLDRLNLGDGGEGARGLVKSVGVDCIQAWYDTLLADNPRLDAFMDTTSQIIML